jgi:hypothetical protein
VTAMDSTAQANRPPMMTRSPVRDLRLAMLKAQLEARKGCSLARPWV